MDETTTDKNLKAGDRVLLSSTRADQQATVLEVRGGDVLVYVANTGQTLQVPRAVVLPA